LEDNMKDNAESQEESGQEENNKPKKKKVIKLSDIDFSGESSKEEASPGSDPVDKDPKDPEKETLSAEDLRWSPEEAVKKFQEENAPQPSADAGDYLNIRPQKNEDVPENIPEEPFPDISGPKDEINSDTPSEEASPLSEPLPDKEYIVPPLTSKPDASFNPDLPKILSIAAGALLVLSIALGIGLMTLSAKSSRLTKEVVDFQNKARANAEVAKKLVTEKQRILTETAPLKEESESIAKKLSYEQNVSAELKKQNDALKTKLGGSQKLLGSLQSEMQGYADEIKSFASEEIKYFQAYAQEKTNSETLAASLDKMENKMASLSSSFNSIENEYRNREADYIYNMAFLYARSQMFDAAIQSFLKFLEMNGSDADVHYNLAIIYDQVKKDKHNALKHYEEYIRLDPQADDLYEISLRINSLKRTTPNQPNSFSNFHVDLEELKY